MSNHKAGTIHPKSLVFPAKVHQLDSGEWGVLVDQGEPGFFSGDPVVNIHDVVHCKVKTAGGKQWVNWYQLIDSSRKSRHIPAKRFDWKQFFADKEKYGEEFVMERPTSR